jgi:hypothetical protein
MTNDKTNMFAFSVVESIHINRLRVWMEIYPLRTTLPNNMTQVKATDAVNINKACIPYLEQFEHVVLEHDDQSTNIASDVPPTK